mmetsp:Transcript_40089/g.106025  ORF Transcript_40089/g.106025 Transcript_40089/m.106025 type:complete len:101 (-) Transcript_40089:431-733(-)
MLSLLSASTGFTLNAVALVAPSNHPVVARATSILSEPDASLLAEASTKEDSMNFKVQFRAEPPPDDSNLSCWLHPDGKRWVCVDDASLLGRRPDHLDDSY